MKNVYLDYASTHPLSKNVKNKLNILSDMWFNPSSIYKASNYNKSVIENIREKFASLINASPEEIIFTGSGSESNALAIDGFIKANLLDKCICSNIEHSSILENPNCIPEIKCNTRGIIEAEQFNKYQNTFFSIMMCNNETGIQQPIKEIADIIHKNDGIIHVDGVQALGKLPIDVRYLDVDMMSFSGHKIGSIRGVGILYVKKGISLSPIIYGAQENGLRGGTYNDLAIKTLGLALGDINFKNFNIVRSKSNYLRSLLYDLNVKYNGDYNYKIPHINNIQIPNCSLDSQQLVSMLDEMGFMISSGSACHSFSNKPSHVLKAMGLTDEECNHSIRVSINENTKSQDLDDFVHVLKNIIEIYSKK